MPISCPIAIEPLSIGAFKVLDYSVMKHVYAAHRNLGRTADECIYQADIGARLAAEGVDAALEVPIFVSFGTFVKHYHLDLVVAAQGVYELKTAAQLSPEHEAQLMNYLMLLDLERGKVVNLRTARIEARFVNVPMRTAQRRAFKVANQDWSGDPAIRSTIIEMLRDWGTGLELPLYHQAIVHLLGGEELVTHMLPMRRDGISLGNQRFHLMEEHAAFRLTAFEEPSLDQARHFIRLIQHSSLHHMHWINIGRTEVTFASLCKD